MDPRAVMVVLSQVPPGYTRALRAWPLERLYYQVETLVFGRRSSAPSNPNASSSAVANRRLRSRRAFAPVLDAFGCPILPMRYESAELAKISINCCLVGSVSVANTLAEVCEKVGGRLERNRAGAEARPAHRCLRLYCARSRYCRWESRTRSRHRPAAVRSAWHRAGLMAAWRRNSRYRRDWPLRQLHERIMSRINEPVIAMLGVTV